MILNPHRVGLVVGVFSGAWQLVWSVLVALGVAQGLTTWILRLNFINVSFGIASFNLLYAVEAILVMTVGGYLAGWFLGYVWNYIQSKNK